MNVKGSQYIGQTERGVKCIGGLKVGPSAFDDGNRGHVLWTAERGAECGGGQKGGLSALDDRKGVAVVK